MAARDVTATSAAGGASTWSLPEAGLTRANFSKSYPRGEFGGKPLLYPVMLIFAYLHAGP